MTRARWWVVATVVSIAMAVGINTIDAPGTMVWFRRQTGGLGTLDTLPLGGATLVHTLLSRLGVEGRALYLQEIVVFDIAFPIALLAMVRLAILQLWSAPWSRRLVLLPWAAFVVDLVENACAAALTLTFPDEPSDLAAFIGGLTALKFVAYGAGLVAVAVGFVAGLARR